MKTFEKPNLPGYVILGTYRSTNSFVGVIERSWSMDLAPDRTNFFWSSKNATSNLGGKFEVDGLESATHYLNHFAERHPDIEFKIYDINDENLPVIIDWDEWRKDSEPAETLSGVKNKFGARNPKFYMPE
jgi:hypothetical protein